MKRMVIVEMLQKQHKIRLSLIFAINLLILLLLFLLLHDISLGFNGGMLYPRMKQEPENIVMELKLTTLVREEDRGQLQATCLSCNSDLHTEVCVTTKKATINTKTLNIYVSSSLQAEIDIENRRLIKPYARKTDSTAMSKVQPLQIIQETNIKVIPDCEHTHSVPAIVFSTGGYSENPYHAFNDIIIPLFLTSRHFRSQVRFLITDYNPRWVRKYGRILQHLSAFDIIVSGANRISDNVHCFPGAVIGLKYHGYLEINNTEIPRGYKFNDFRKFLVESYRLKVVELNPKPINPIVVLISRKKSRRIINEDEIVKMMKKLGLKVHVASPDDTRNLDKFSSLVNSCHVMVGVHGAGLINQVFLPKGAVVVQVVPIGLEWASTNFYANPISELGFRYLEYRIELNESSLSRAYRSSDPVIANPPSMYAKGFDVAKAVYFDAQNLWINVTKFKGTMTHAFELLQQ